MRQKVGLNVWLVQELMACNDAPDNNGIKFII
jgi:hypothetical protein